jgi:hypothetical protein
MKRPTRLINLSFFMLCALIVGTSFLTPERIPKPKSLKARGELSFEYKGKKYIAGQPLLGNVTISPDKKAYLIFSGDKQEGTRNFGLQFNFKHLPALKAGQYQLTTVQNHMTNNQKDGCIMVNYVTLIRGSEDPALQEPADIAASSDKGTFTITSVSVNGQYATISGSFSFTGKNDLEYAADKTIAIKGAFKDLTLRYIAPPGS